METSTTAAAAPQIAGVTTSHATTTSPAGDTSTSSPSAAPHESSIGPSMFGIDSNDPAGSLVERGELSPADLAQISRLMNAMGRLRDAERRISEASATYMRLNQTDMRALHYLIVCGNSGTVATPSGIAQHLKISTASTTKLLDRLEKAGHVRREPHPSDRRALAIAITPQTRQAAMESVGRLQARRVRAAARLSPAERETVIAFLADMADEIDMKHASWGHPGSPEHTEL